MRSTAAKKKVALDPADRRKQILRAAIEVFAERGFHKTRISDIAKKAKVAYGLIYHYFDSKDHVLSTIFEESWGVFVKVLRDIAHDSHRSQADKLASVSDLLIGALRHEPALIQVIIQEVSRSDRLGLGAKVDAFEEAFKIVRGIVHDGQKKGELSSAVDAQVATYLFFGALETVCTGVMLKKISVKNDAEAEALKKSLRRALLEGIKE
ncbi:MAG: TetR/AcrR family transcriptional regulator [Myxococcota bacterium]